MKRYSDDELQQLKSKGNFNCSFENSDLVNRYPLMARGKTLLIFSEYYNIN